MIFIIIITLIVLVVISSAREKVFHIMGTYAIIELPDNKEYKAYMYLRAIEEKLSDYIETSDISKINKNAGKSWVKPSQEVLEVIKKSIDVSELSKGKFDITVGSLSIRAWRLKEISEEEAKRLINYKNILIQDGRVKLAKEKMAIDIGGIGKGFAIQKAFEKLGTTWGFIAIAGDMKIWGHSRLIGIYDPVDKSVVFIGHNAKDLCISSSGNYYKKHILEGSNSVIGVTVIHKDCTYADALSTALFAMNESERQELINKLSLPVFILYENQVYYFNNEFIGFFKDYQISSSWKPKKQE